MSYTVVIEGIDRLRDALRKSPETVAKRLESGLEAASLVVLKNANETNVPHKSGNLLRSFTVRKSLLQREVFPDSKKAPYAIYVHEGTKAHRIVPRSKKALYWAGARHPVKGVNHPGTKANKFMPRILDRATPEIQRGMLQVVEKILNDLATK